MAKEGKASLLIELKDNVSDGLKKLKDNVAEFKSNVLEAAGAGAALVAILVKATLEFAQQETSIARLNIALKNAGIAGNNLSDALVEQANALQKSTGFADDAIISADALGARFGFTGKQLQELIPRVLDLAAATGTDLNSAMVILGKSMETGSTMALKRMGIVVDDTAFKTHNFNGVMAELDGKFKGTASTLNDTTGGQMKQFGLAIDDLFKSIGRLINGPMVLWISKTAELTASVAEFLNTLHTASEAQAETGKTAQSLMLIQTAQVASLKDEKVALETKLKVMGDDNTLTKEIIATKQELARVNSLIASTEKALSTTTVKAGAEQMAALAKQRNEEARQEKAAREAAMKAHIADVDKETKTLLSKFQTRGQQKEALAALFGQQDAAILAAGLSEEENMKLISQVRELDALGKFHDSEVLQENAVQFARQNLNKKRIEDLNSTLSFISSLSTAKNKELAAIGKAAAIGTATVDTYQAANKALASAPPPWNFALAAAVVTAGLVNVGKIVGVQLAEGGVVLPRSGGTLATIGEAGSAEAVIPLNDPKARAMLGGGGGGNNITIQAGAFMGSPADARKFAKMIDRELFHLKRNGQAVS